jgi:hypothetical protein
MATENSDTVTTYVDTVDSTTTYVGIAPRQSLTSSSKWQISKVVTNGTIIYEKYPNGSDAFKFVWDDRASYTYE